ncbi:unnamed protein product [Auanema sp. JU1783]|nr:unnamed protein product [Auanema sp. JU1783]
MSAWALPPKGCTSCMLAPIESHHRNPGNYKVEKLLSDDNCFIQRLTCNGIEEKSETFVQFNFGQSGFFAQGDQTVDLECNAHGEWIVNRQGAVLVVESLACLSTWFR